MPIYRIRSGELRPSDRPVEGSLQMINGMHLGLYLDHVAILSLTTEGRVYLNSITPSTAEGLGLLLDYKGHIATHGQPVVQDIIAYEVKAEREACAKIAEEHVFALEYISGFSKSTLTTLREAIAQRIRERNKTTEPTKETSKDATLSKP